MSEFLRLLAVYYACDHAAALRPLTAAEVAACMGHYNAVKSHFVTDLPPPASSEDRSTTSNLAFTRFKRWESENQRLVADLRARVSH